MFRRREPMLLFVDAAALGKLVDDLAINSGLSAAVHGMSLNVYPSYNEDGMYLVRLDHHQAKRLLERIPRSDLQDQYRRTS